MILFFGAYWRFLRASVSVDVRMTSEEIKGDAEVTSLFLFAYFPVRRGRRALPIPDAIGRRSA